MSGQRDNKAAISEVAKKKVVWQLPEMDSVPVRRGLTYRAVSGADVLMDVYYPARALQPVPLVIMPMAYPDPTARVRFFGPLTSWAQLLAASGVAAVVYGAEAPADDAHALLRHVRAGAEALEIDADRIGVLAGSANATVGLSILMQDPHVRCAAFLYGYTMDLDGSTAVADMARQTGFANACAGKTVDDLPPDVPMLFVRAGRDQFLGLNDALDRVVSRVLSRNLPVTVINHATGAHGFDVDEDTPASRAIVQQVVAFLQRNLLG